MHQHLCLKGLFLHLRDRGLELSVRDYVDALKALRAGYGMLDRQRLLWLCKTLWARTGEEERHIESVFLNYLPFPSREEMEEALQTIAGAPDTDVLEESGGSAADRPETSPAEEVETDDLEPEPEVAAAFVSPDEMGLGVPRAYAQPSHDETFILTPKPALAVRDLIVVFRRYRQATRTGPPVELDVQATLDEISRTGHLVAPVLIPARCNQAALSILLDVSDSMIPWRSLHTVVRRALRQSNLGRWKLLYFHNVPDILYEDAELENETVLDLLCRHPLAAPWLIVSDAGAARGIRRTSRIEETVNALRRLRKASLQPIAWVNPMPCERWRSSSAAAIQRRAPVPMFEFTQDGLITAMDVLRGTKLASSTAGSVLR